MIEEEKKVQESEQKKVLLATLLVAYTFIEKSPKLAKRKMEKLQKGTEKEKAN